MVSKDVRRNVFLGGGGARLSTIFDGKSKRGREAPERGEGVGGGVPPLTRGSFCSFEIEIERSHFGWNFGEIFNKKVSKYIFMENVCFLHEDNG